MSITQGSLIKRGDWWHWKFRLNGETRWEALKVKTKREAEVVRQRRIAAYHADTDAFVAVEVNPRVEDFEREYFEWMERNRRRKTIETQRMFWSHLVAFTGAKRVGDIKQRDIERMKKQMASRWVSGRPVGPTSINNALRSLKALFNRGRQLGLMNTRNPVEGVERLRVTWKKPDFLSSEEIEKVVATSQEMSTEIYWVCLLGMFAGLRKKEIVNARWEWFDFDRRLVLVKAGHGFDIKDGEERHLPMSDRLYKALRPSAIDSGFLFESRVGEDFKGHYRYDPKKSLKRLATKSGVLRLGFQLLRHTFGSQHSIAGTSIYKISKWMGHSSVDVTARHYAGLQDYDEDIDRF